MPLNSGDLEVISAKLSLILAAAIPAGESHIGQVDTYVGIVRSTPVISTTIYGALDNIGGRPSFQNIFRVNGGKGILQYLIITDKSAQKADLQIHLFDSLPENGVDNTVYAVGSDITKHLGIVFIATGDYIEVSSGIWIAVMPNLAIPVNNVSGNKNLYYTIKNVTDTPTYTAVSSLQITGSII